MERMDRTQRAVQQYLLRTLSPAEWRQRNWERVVKLMNSYSSGQGCRKSVKLVFVEGKAGTFLGGKAIEDKSPHVTGDP